MNLFRIKNDKINCLSLIVDEKTNCEENIIGNNIFYFRNNLVVGFNIFDIDFIEEFKPGRQYVDEKKLMIIEKKYNIKIDRSFCHFVVGEIVELKSIDNSHLTLCNVNVGNDNLQIVCGAKNVKKNMLVVVATNGILMNNCMYIKEAKLKGFNSNGMLCSQKELNISGFNDDGIINLDKNKYKVGDIFMEAYVNCE